MVSFGYASDGTRTSKTANGVTTAYYYVGGRLYGEMTGSNKLVYLYDDTGTPYGYVYNNATYYYERNAQGDVVSLFNTNGVRIANYTYDAWGNVRSITDQNGNDVSGNPTHQGNLNPIRYRGYYYDAELNMYWLTTRFYDPAIGRFINADTQLNEGTLGNNLYAYCCNDPVNGHDPTGTCTCNTMGFDCSSCREARGCSLNATFDDNWLSSLSKQFSINYYTGSNELFKILPSISFLGISLEITFGYAYQTNASAIVGMLIGEEKMGLAVCVAIDENWSVVFSVDVDWNSTNFSLGIVYAPKNYGICYALTIEIEISHITTAAVAVACAAAPVISTAVSSLVTAANSVVSSAPLLIPVGQQVVNWVLSPQGSTTMSKVAYA